MKRPIRSISERLHAMQVAVSNTIAFPEIKELVGQYGYGSEKIDEGKTLYTEALMAVNLQTAYGGSQGGASTRVRQTEKAAHDTFQRLSKVARAIFKNDPGKLKSLGLQGTMPKRIAEFIGAAYTLFDNAKNVSELRDELSKYGYNDKKLEAEKQKITDYDKAVQLHEGTKGAAQQTTRDQEAALAKMDEWLTQYFKIAKVALVDRRELLEQIGIFARSVKSKAQRGAGKKASETRKAKK